MKKTIIALVLMLAMLASLFSGCGIGTVSDPNQGGNSGNNEELDANKSQITVAVLDGGLGSQWIENAADRFEELYKDKSFEEGKTGCQISILASRSFDGSALTFTPLTHDIYFTEGVDYYAMTNNGQMESLTEIMTTPLTEYGEDQSILDKIDPVMQEFLLTSDGNYYGIPYYETFYNFAYDLDLWDAKSFYISADGGWTNASGNLSNGPDGVSGTSDDGLPATYAEFGKLITHIKDAGVIPFATANNATDYLANFLFEYVANNEGKELMELNYTFDGVATDLIEVSEDGTVTELPDTTITMENGNELTRQSGKYYALKFCQDILAKADNYKTSDTHINAQKSYVRGGIANDKPYAMIMEGSWWENEAKAAFEELKKDGYERHNYAVMPKPFPTEEQVGQKATWLSQSASYGFVANNSDNKTLALEFLRFLHTDEELSHFTAEVKMTRPLNYPILEEDQAQLTTYAKSILELKEKSDIVYPYSTRVEWLNNPLIFSGFAWPFQSTVDGYDYRNPWLYFTQVNGASPEAYFNGVYDYVTLRWPGIV